MDLVSAPASWGLEAPAIRADVFLPGPRPATVNPDAARRRRLLQQAEHDIARPGGWPIPPQLRFYWDTDPDQPGDPDTGGPTWDTYKWGR